MTLSIRSFVRAGVGAIAITAFDLRVQRYRGEPDLTWIESEGAFSAGPTTSYIDDRHYNVIATVKAGNGLTEDIHEFELTPKGTALILAYNTTATTHVNSDGNIIVQTIWNGATEVARWEVLESPEGRFRNALRTVASAEWYGQFDEPNPPASPDNRSKRSATRRSSRCERTQPLSRKGQVGHLRGDSRRLFALR